MWDLQLARYLNNIIYKQKYMENNFTDTDINGIPQEWILAYVVYLNT